MSSHACTAIPTQPFLPKKYERIVCSFLQKGGGRGGGGGGGGEH